MKKIGMAILAAVIKDRDTKLNQKNVNLVS
jgi:hypothetical protein